MYMYLCLVIQFPLPEVVVIHQDPTCHRQLKAMEGYMLEELNVRSLVLAEEDSKYGVRLVAEPDNDRLGKRLKRDFKTIAPSVKGIPLLIYMYMYLGVTSQVLMIIIMQNTCTPRRGHLLIRRTLKLFQCSHYTVNNCYFIDLYYILFY